MKKYFLPLFATLIVSSVSAQFITTNPSTTPVTVGADLNLDLNKVLKFNNLTVLSNKGTNSTFVGAFAGKLVTTGAGNSFIGVQAGENTQSGEYNVAIGFQAGTLNSGGNYNSFIGAKSGYNTTTGSSNLFMGTYSGFSNQSGSGNIFIGNTSGYYTTSGGDNAFLGNASGQSNIGGGKNTFLGGNSGLSNTSGSENTYIGYGAQGVNNITNATAIGSGAYASISNSVILGQAANVGIGTGSPSEKLHVVGGVRFQGLPTDAPGGTAVQYLVADATGKIYVYTGTAPARIGAPEGPTASIPTSFNENWTLKNDFLYNKNKKGIIIGEGITALPKGYGMYVTDGILTEKVKVAIKNSSDWADYVFNKDYKKMSLTEVEKFIKVNKHLPNIPSAAEMVSEGNDLAKTDAKLLEKIEELTLYMIEMKKENAQMKRQINTLKRKLK